MHNSCLTTRRLAAGLLALLAVLVLSACDDKAAPVATADSAVGTDGAAGSDAGATDAAASSDAAATDTSASDTASDGLVQDDAATDVVVQTDAGGNTDAMADTGGTDAEADTASTDATADTTGTDASAQTDGTGTTDAAAGTDAGPQNTCVGAADSTLCDDGNPCTKGDLCTAGSCAGAALNCDDDNTCTVDSCKDGVCVHAPLGLPGPPAGCDDDNPCTLGDGCQNGACQSGEVVCECSKTADCGKFEDGNLCNGTLFCNLGTGKCQVAPSSVVVCDTSTDTACSQNTCVQLTGACTLTAVSDGLPCSDGNTCTAGDACSSGSCSPGTNTCLCTNDNDCDSQEDGNACNGTLFCNKSNGQCELNPATVVVCPTAQDSECRLNTCDPSSGICGLVDQTGLCDDANTCTSGESCSGGQCTGGIVTCECAVDSDCAGKEDGNACNGKLYCDLSSNTCKVNPATVVSCPTVGNTTCRTLACEPTSGACEWNNAPSGTSCDADGTGCTPSDTCVDGSCKADDNICICTTTADCGVHEDGNVCNGTLYCDKLSNTCRLNPATVVTCATVANTACQANTCNPQDGTCALQAINEGGLCDADGNACTNQDVCNSGSCLQQANTCICQQDSDCGVHEDGNACNGTLFCNKANNTCEVNPATIPTCASGNDTACLTSRCNPATGTCGQVAEPEFKPCEADGNPCTLNDYCQAGSCMAGLNLCPCQIDTDCGELDDGDLCNGLQFCDKSGAIPGCKALAGSAVTCDPATSICALPACNPTTGSCQDQAINEGLDCDDDNACTSNDLCVNAACLGTPKDCNDNLSCTTDSCDPQTLKCKFIAINNGSPCNDGDLCTEGTTCEAEECGAGTTVTCNDNEACTADSCDPTKGCIYTLTPGCVPTRNLPYTDTFACGSGLLWQTVHDLPTGPYASNWAIAQPSTVGVEPLDGCALTVGNGQWLDCTPPDIVTLESPLVDATVLQASKEVWVDLTHAGSWEASWVVLQIRIGTGTWTNLQYLYPQGPGWTTTKVVLAGAAGNKFQFRIQVTADGCEPGTYTGPVFDKVAFAFETCAGPSDCDDNELCTNNVCDVSTGICSFPALETPPQGAGCDDLDPCGDQIPVCQDGVFLCVASAADPLEDGKACGTVPGAVCQGGTCSVPTPAEVGVPPEPAVVAPNNSVPVSITLYDPNGTPLQSDITSVVVDLSKSGFTGSGSAVLSQTAVSLDGKTRTYAGPISTAGGLAGVHVLPITVTERNGKSWQTATWVALTPATVVHVGAGKTYESLSDALNASPPGSTYLIHPGTYSGSANKNLGGLPGSTLIGVGGAEKVIVDCGGLGRFAQVDNNGFLMAGVTMAGLTIQNCSAGAIRYIGNGLGQPDRDLVLVGMRFVGNTQGNHGGALTITGPTNVVRAALTSFENNQVEGYRGGAIAISDGATLKMGWSRLTGNQSLWGIAGNGNAGGAISVTGATTTVEVNHSYFAGNDSGTGGGGDAIKVTDGTATISNSVLRDNKIATLAMDYGKLAVYNSWLGNSKGSPTIYTIWGQLIVEDCELANSESGGIAAYYGDVTIRRTHFHHHLYSTTLFVSGQSASVLEDLSFDHNSVLGNGMAYFDSATTLTRWSVQDNEVGGATVYFGGRGNVLDSVFRNNHTTSGDGGAISGVSALTIRNSVFSGNSAKGKGGAIYHSAYDDGQSAPNGGGLLLENCLLHHNSADGDGGAVYATAGSLPATTPGPDIRGCTVANNSAASGGAVYLHAGVAMNLRDSIFWANTASGEGDAIALRNDIAVTASIERCLLSAKEDDVYDPAYTINGGGYKVMTLGNFSADPLFVGSGDDPFLLSQIAAGQAVNSPAVEPAGGQAAGLVSWGNRTTRTDGMPDSGLLDFGWHAPVP